MTDAAEAPIRTLRGRLADMPGHPFPLVLECPCFQTHPAAVALDRLTVRRGGRDILRDISLSFAEGTITAVVGPSGVGKTTLMGCLNGLLPAAAGTVVVAGAGRLDNAKALREARRHTATVFQDHALIDRLPAIDNVLLGLADSRHPLSPLPWPQALRRRAAQALDEVGLLGRATARTAHLSGGERQRVGIARALVRRPRLLLGDEPFASVDPARAMRQSDVAEGRMRPGETFRLGEILAERPAGGLKLRYLTSIRASLGAQRFQAKHFQLMMNTDAHHGSLFLAAWQSCSAIVLISCRASAVSGTQTHNFTSPRCRRRASYSATFCLFVFGVRPGTESMGGRCVMTRLRPVFCAAGQRAAARAPQKSTWRLLSQAKRL